MRQSFAFGQTELSRRHLLIGSTVLGMVAMTHEFEEYRPWTTIGQFRAEIGKYVGDDVVAEDEAYVFVPISPNDADTETLQQLPGIDEDNANTLIASQPYADNAAFLTALASQVSAEQASLAATYLAAS